MSVSIEVHNPGLEGAANSCSDSMWATANPVEPLALVQAALREVTAASDELVAVLEALAAAMRELAAIEPPEPGADGTVAPARQRW